MKCRGSNGDGDTEFDDVDVTDGDEWASYDADADCTVGVWEFKSQLVVSKGGKKK